MMIANSPIWLAPPVMGDDTAEKLDAHNQVPEKSMRENSPPNLRLRMNLLDFEIKLRKDYIKFQKNHLKRGWMFGLIYPTLFLWCVVNLYLTPSNWVHGILLGVNISSFLFYIIVMLDARREYQSDCRMLEFYETRYKEAHESDN